VLQRKAIVYVRQSTPQQVQTNLESQRRQYELVDVARRRGFTNVEIIDDDVGRSASGAVDRPGFDRLVAALCAGQVGAVLCLDASRLARNGRDWHHLLELCGLVDARVIDLDGVLRGMTPAQRQAALRFTGASAARGDRRPPGLRCRLLCEGTRPRYPINSRGF
jgi:DNA invertase Pin-like site-specific DNA recombinase